jgi:nucleotide-binding universal stress UspA family protein
MKNTSFQLVNTLQSVRNGHFHDISSENRIPIFTRGENNGSQSEVLASSFKKILVPVTLSGSSAPGLGLARKLARESGAQLVLLHVVQLNIAGEERGIHRARLLSELCLAAELELMQLAASIADHVTTEIIVCEGRPAEAIVQTAGRVRADAIVMSVRHHHPWLKWLHRNTAFHVVRQAPCAVILVSMDKRGRKEKPVDARLSHIGNAVVNIANHENANPA